MPVYTTSSGLGGFFVLFLVLFLPGSLLISWPPRLNLWPVLPAQGHAPRDDSMSQPQLGCSPSSFHELSTLLAGRSPCAKQQAPSVGPLAPNSASAPMTPRGASSRLAVQSSFSAVVPWVRMGPSRQWLPARVPRVTLNPPTPSSAGPEVGAAGWFHRRPGYSRSVHVLLFLLKITRHRQRGGFSRSAFLAPTP